LLLASWGSAQPSDASAGRSLLGRRAAATTTAVGGTGRLDDVVSNVWRTGSEAGAPDTWTDGKQCISSVTAGT